MLPTVEESIISLFASTSFLDTLPFQATKGRIADTALAPAELFEGTYIRDAEEHELGLFSTEEGSSSHDGLQAGGGGSSSIDHHHSTHERDDRARHRRSLLGRSTGGSSTARNNNIGNNNGQSNSRNAWHFPKSRGPARIGAPDKATPLKKRRAQPAHQNKNTADPEAYLLAARKLLQTYPMQRASEHVELLYSQYEGLMDAIADLEETIHRPAPKASTSAITIEASAEDDIASLEAEIKREELEILALKETRKELDKESKAIEARSRSSNTASSTRQGPRTTTTRQQAVNMPSLKDVNKPTRQPPASTTMTSAPTAGIGGKRVPSIVARRMAEQKEAAAARSRANITPTLSSPLPNNQKSPARTPSVPSLNVQSPSNTSMQAQNENEDEDQTIVIGDRKTAIEQVDAEFASPPRQQLQPRIPADQFDKILAKIISALPGNAKRTVSKDADSVLSALTSTISQAETGKISPTSSISGSSITASPASSTLTPVNIIELHLLHTFLSLLLSLELQASTNSKEKLNLIIRKPLTSSLTTTPPITSNTSPSNNGIEAFLNMNNLKIYLGGKAKNNNWNEDLGHKAIYGLVAKRILKIDRKGRDALVCFT